MGRLFRNPIRQVLFPSLYKIFGRNSFSQAGEDVVIDFLLQSISLPTPQYLELGVYDPRNGSNTYKFYLRGARGVLVEADAQLIHSIRRQRPKDTVIHAGVGIGENRQADFFVFNEPSINTFNKDEAEERARSGRFQLLRTVQVPVLNINTLIEKNFDNYPHFLSIDIEGLDYEVLSDLDTTRFPIPIIVAETCTYSESHLKAKDKRIDQLMHSSGYFTYADTYINTVFVHRSWFESQNRQH